MKRSQSPPVRTLTDRQRYLLARIPSDYQMNGYHEPAKPPEVRRAEAIMNRWEKAQGLAKCKAKKRAEALRRKAQEAVYFEDDRKALAIVQQCEKMLKGCED